MTEFKGTKAPWTIGFSHLGKKCAYSIKEFGGNAIEDCYNAKLISAAPDLLEACQQALKYVSVEKPAYDVLRNAIKKATE